MVLTFSRTVARLVKEGRAVTYVIVTNGNKGSADPSVTSAELVRIRREEQRRAAHVLGVNHVEFLEYEDGELEDTRELRRDITRQIPAVATRAHHHAQPSPHVPQFLCLRLQRGCGVRGWGA
jgi:LmbE family N-acetylglucosaminyl deacetylase